MRVLVLATLLVSGSTLAKEPSAKKAPAPTKQLPRPFVPAAAKDIPGYKENVLCEKYTEDDPDTEEDESDDSGCDWLRQYSLSELAIRRNTIFARYGWSGFRKTWLREHFQKQPWFKPNPNFSYKLLSRADRENVRLIAQQEMGFTHQQLEKMQDELLAKAGKAWGDAPTYEDDEGNDIPACSHKGDTTDENGQPLASVVEFQREVRDSKDCQYHGYPQEPSAPDFDRLSAEERIELGLLSRAMGSFASDDASRGTMEKSLDEVLSLTDLRELSLRDLRLLRNTLYARRGRPFKSPVLRNHFAHMPWYKEDPTYTDKRLTKNDLRNVKLILEVEKELGGSLRDEDFLISDPSLRREDPDPGYLSGV
jgi:hypothetical protein